MNIMGWGEEQGPQTTESAKYGTAVYGKDVYGDPLRPITEAERDEHRSEPQPRDADGSLVPTPDAVDPGTTLESKSFVVAYPEGDLNALDIDEQPTVSVVDVFALVATYDHEVGNPVAPVFGASGLAREAGLRLLTTNPNVISFRVDTLTTRKQ